VVVGVSLHVLGGGGGAPPPPPPHGSEPKARDAHAHSPMFFAATSYWSSDVPE